MRIRGHIFTGIPPRFIAKNSNSCNRVELKLEILEVGDYNFKVLTTECLVNKGSLFCQDGLDLNSGLNW